MTKEIAEPLSEIGRLPASGFVRQAQLVTTKTDKVKPVPFSAATLWRKVKNGTFPPPVKLSNRVTAWRVEDVRSWMAARDEAA